MLTPEQKQRKDSRLLELIRQYAAEFIERESNNKSLITVTRVVLSSDKKKASIYFTTLPETYEDQVLLFLERTKGELISYLKKHISSAHLPFIDIAIDKGERNRQRIDMISLKENNNEEFSNEN